jgi:hypothetical protein
MADTSKPARKKRGKQLRIEGAEPDRDEELDGAAEVYYEALMDRVRHSKSESEAKDSLIELMLSKQVYRYENDYFVVVATSKTNVNVKAKKATESADAQE